MATIDPGALSEGAEVNEHLLTRSDLFRAAHALVRGLEWGEKFSVYDVLQVARFLELEDED
ncbi:hypothetical protein ACWDX6_24060 [Streptomyces sp. NPDC003027]